MNLLLRVYKFAMNIVYTFFKLLPTRKRILFLSRQDNKLSIDFTYMINDIKIRYPEYEIKVLTKSMIKTSLLENFKYVFHPFHQLFYLATSSICVTDGYQMTLSTVKHKNNLKIIQIWHSLAAFKKFGYQTLKNKKEIEEAKIMRMHLDYNSVICASKETLKYFKKAFGPNNNFYICPLPRVDYLIDSKISNKDKVYKLYPELKNKTIILYAPTYRDYNEYKIEEMVKEFSNSKYTLIIKKHMRSKVNVDKLYSYDLISTMEALCVADYVITDYSAISLEAAILEKKVLLYLYDYEKYNEYEGLNVNLYKELAPYVFDNMRDLISCINKNNYDLEIVKLFKNKYIDKYDGKATKKLVDYIVNEEVKEKN